MSLETLDLNTVDFQAGPGSKSTVPTTSGHICLRLTSHIFSAVKWKLRPQSEKQKIFTWRFSWNGLPNCRTVIKVAMADGIALRGAQSKLQPSFTVRLVDVQDPNHIYS